MVGFLFLAISLLATVRAGLVAELDPKTIETRGLGAFFVEFYQPNEPSFQDFSSKYEKVAQVYESNSVYFGRINCEDYSQYCKDKGVTEFPAVLGSLHRSVWKPYKEGTLENFVQENKPFRNTEGKSKPITTLREMREIAENSEPWFIKFYAPWCGHCKNMAPDWVQVASQLKEKVNVGEVNCDANKDICNAYDVAGLPTIKYFIHGTSIQYSGERKAEPLIEFAMDYSSTAVRGVRRDEQFDTLLPKYDVNLIYVTENKEKKDIDRLEKLAQKYIESVPFYTTEDTKTAERLEAETLPVIAILKDELKYVYDGKQDLSDWIRDHSQPLVHTVLTHNSNDILRKHPGTVVLGLFSPDDVHSIVKFRTLSEAHPDTFFAQLDAWAYAPFVSRAYGLNLVHIPGVVFLQPKKQKYFKWDENNALFDINQPEQITRALANIETLTPVSTSPSKAMGAAGKVIDFIQDYWVLFTGGFFVLLLVLIIFIVTSEDEKPELKKE